MNPAKHMTISIWAMIIFFGFAGMASANDNFGVGVIDNLTGKVTILRNDGEFEIRKGDHVFPEDIIITHTNSTVGIIFEDDGLMSMGPESRLTIDEFIFNPDKKQYSFITKILKGTVSYLSGKVSKLSPESVKMETPLAVIGTRGTHFVVEVE